MKLEENDMSIFADREAVNQLEKLFQRLGEYGGLIITRDPMFWPLDLRVVKASANAKLVQLGIFEILKGKVYFDPQFTLYLTMRDNEIAKVEIKNYISETYYVSIKIDENDMAYAHSTLFGHVEDIEEQDPFGMAARFSSFMDTLTLLGPYLRMPKPATRYSCTYSKTPFSSLVMVMASSNK